MKTVTFDLECEGREEIDVGTVVMEEGEILQGAGISEKQLLRRESDRIVYDVQGDPDAHRINMAEFMEKIPELKQDYANRGNFHTKTFLDDRIDFQVSLNTNIGEDNGYSRSGSVTRDADGSIVRSTATDRTYVQTSPMRLNGGVALSYNISREKRIGFKYTYKDNRSAVEQSAYDM